MNDAGPRRSLAEAVRAHTPVPMECCDRTDDTVVVQCLHYRNARVGARIVDGWGKLGEQVVEMRNVEGGLAQDPTQPAARPYRPKSLCRYGPARLRHELPIVDNELDDLMAVAYQQIALPLENQILSAGGGIAGMA
jgi:hypothetical protein